MRAAPSLELRVEGLQQQLMLEITKRSDALRDLQLRHAGDVQHINDQLQQLRMENEVLRQQRGTSVSSIGYACHRHGRMFDPTDTEPEDSTRKGTILGRLSDVESRLNLCQRTIEERHQRLERSVNEYFFQNFSREAEKLRAVTAASCRDFFSSNGYFDLQRDVAALTARMDRDIQSDVHTAISHVTGGLVQRISVVENDVRVLENRFNDATEITKLSRLVATNEVLQRQLDVRISQVESNTSTIAKELERRTDALNATNRDIQDLHNKQQDTQQRQQSLQHALTLLEQTSSQQLVDLHDSVTRLGSTSMSASRLDKIENALLKSEADLTASRRRQEQEMIEWTQRVQGIEFQLLENTRQQKAFQTETTVNAQQMASRVAEVERGATASLNEALARCASKEDITSLKALLKDLPRHQQEVTTGAVADAIERLDANITNRLTVFATQEFVRRSIAENSTSTKEALSSMIDTAVLPMAQSAKEVSREIHLANASCAALQSKVAHQDVALERMLESLAAQTQNVATAFAAEQQHVRDTNDAIRRLREEVATLRSSNSSAPKAEGPDMAQVEETVSRRLTDYASSWQTKLERAVKVIADDTNRNLSEAKDLAKETASALERSDRDHRFSIAEVEAKLNARLSHVDNGIVDLRTSVESIRRSIEEQTSDIHQLHQETRSLRTATTSAAAAAAAALPTQAPKQETKQEDVKLLASRVTEVEQNAQLLLDLIRTIESRISETSSENADFWDKLRGSLAEHSNRISDLQRITDDLRQAVADDRDVKLNEDMAVEEIITSRHDQQRSQPPVRPIVWLAQCHANNHTVLTEVLGLVRTVAEGVAKVETDAREHETAIDVLSQQMGMICLKIGMELVHHEPSQVFLQDGEDNQDDDAEGDQTAADGN